MEVALSPIEAHERTLGQIFTDTYAFEIPPYQRPYAWEADQTRELLDDLVDAMDNHEGVGAAYFLGSIVLIKRPGIAQSKVVDGQQRLTTLTIMLSTLRDLTSDSRRQNDRARYVFEEANPDRGTQERARVTLRPQDRAFFQRHIQTAGSTNQLPNPDSLQGSQQRIIENAVYIRTKLREMDEERRNKLVAFIIQHCYLVVVAVPTAETARRIFTVLNARGLDLAPTDILKADLLERAGTAREVDLAARWEAVEEAIGREKMVELFGHIRMIYERDKPRLSLESGFTKFVTPFAGESERFVADVLEPIADAVDLINDSKAVGKQFGMAAAVAVRSLERIDNKDWMPPALLRLWKRGTTDAEEIGKFLRQLERLAYFMFVCRHGVNNRIARFAAVMDEYEPRAGRASPAVGIELSDVEQSQFMESLDGPLYLKSRVCKPVLQRLDEALSSGGASYDELVSIEHVLPQTVGEESGWQALFPDKQERDRWVHRIANLVFLTKRINTRASNWDFERKKKEYFTSKDGTSPFPLTQGVLQTAQWSVGHLTERQTKLVARLAEVWRLTPTARDASGALESGDPDARRTKAPKADLEVLIRKGLLRNGDRLYLVDYQGKRLGDYEAVVSGSGLDFKGDRYTMSNLAQELLKRVGFKSDSVRGPAHWVTEKGVSVKDLWEGLMDRRRSDNG